MLARTSILARSAKLARIESVERKLLKASIEEVKGIQVSIEPVQRLTTQTKDARA